MGALVGRPREPGARALGALVLPAHGPLAPNLHQFPHGGAASRIQAVSAALPGLLASGSLWHQAHAGTAAERACRLPCGHTPWARRRYDAIPKDSAAHQDLLINLNDRLLRNNYTCSGGLASGRHLTMGCADPAEITKHASSGSIRAVSSLRDVPVLGGRLHTACVAVSTLSGLRGLDAPPDRPLIAGRCDL
jgi:hypothetical protein